MIINTNNIKNDNLFKSIPSIEISFNTFELLIILLLKDLSSSSK